MQCCRGIFTHAVSNDGQHWPLENVPGNLVVVLYRSEICMIRQSDRSVRHAQLGVDHMRLHRQGYFPILLCALSCRRATKNFPYGFLAAIPNATDPPDKPGILSSGIAKVLRNPV